MKGRSWGFSHDALQSLDELCKKMFQASASQRKNLIKKESNELMDFYMELGGKSGRVVGSVASAA